MRLLPWEYAVRNLGRSPVRLGLCLAGGLLVVLLVLAAGSFVRGMSLSLRSSGSERNVILLGAGSEESVERSEIRPDVPGLVLGTVGGIRTRLGVAYVSPEVHLQTALRLTRDAPEEIIAILRGITTEAFLVHPQVQIVEGRPPMGGKDEMLVGRLVSARLGVAGARMATGQKVWFDNREWTVCGRFEAPGTVFESEIWVPLRDLQIAAKRDNLSCVVLTLDGAEYADVDAFCKQRLDLELVALREPDYYGKLSAFYRPVRTMVWITALLVALGGLLGGLNTMYAAFASRVREVGALQAIGFSRRAIVVSLVQESVLATAGGALAGAVIGLSTLDGLAVSFSAGAFGLVLDSRVMFQGLVAGVILGIIGACPPAWRCLRLPISDALKAV